MNWVAPTEKDAANDALEKRLWDAADQFRANSGLKSQEYSAPVLGLIFLRFAEARFSAQRAKLGKMVASSRRGSRVDDPAAYHADGILYLPVEARFDYLLNLPEAENIGAKVNAAMRDTEKLNPQLAGILPKTYNLFTGALLKELLKKISEIPASLDYDAFGRIYEYFLGEFAMTEGQGGGEFYTPSSIVRLLTEVIEPYHGRILDPACGSGGMFVQSARFVAEHKASPPSTRPVGHPSPNGRRAGDEGAQYTGDPARELSRTGGHPSPNGRRDGDEGAQYTGDPARELSIYGVEKTDETGRLCRMNLAVHGLEGAIRHGGNINSYYDDPFEACGTSLEPSPGASHHPLPVGEGRGEGHEIKTKCGRFDFASRHLLPMGEGRGESHEIKTKCGRFDFVLANPPFNVNAVDKERLKDSVGPGRRFPFGLPRTDNANYLWIQLFYSALNEQGRAGFVMANSASDARSSEQEIRKKLIEARAVDVMVAVGPNMFYTVTLPCTLWFMDKVKASLPSCPPSPHPSPKGRGGFKFQGLVEQARELRKKQTPAEEALWELIRNRQLAGLKFRRQHQIGDYIVDFFCAEHGLVVELDGSVHDTLNRKKIDNKRDAYLRSLGHTVVRFPNDRVFDDIENLFNEILSVLPSPSGRGGGGEGEQHVARTCDIVLPSTSGRGGGGEGEQHVARTRDTVLFIDARHIYRQVDRAHREWTPAQIGFIANIVRLYRGEELDFTLGGEEAKAKIFEVFATQPSPGSPNHPLPNGEGKKIPSTPGRGGQGEGSPPSYRDVPGLCKAARLEEITANGWSLNPGRYVGVAAGEVVSDEDFKEQFEELNEELETLNTAARELEATIARNATEILET